MKKKVKEKVRKNDPKAGIGKIKTKTWFFHFFEMLAQFQSS